MVDGRTQPTAKPGFPDSPRAFKRNAFSMRLYTLVRRQMKYAIIALMIACSDEGTAVNVTPDLGNTQLTVGDVASADPGKP